MNAEDLAQDEDLGPPPKKQRKAKPYVPGKRTGAYAILMALSSLPEDSLQSLTKNELIEVAQPYCDSSFTESDPGKFYTAWKSMDTVVNKDLVQERGRPTRRYVLTDEGWEIAKRLQLVEKGEAVFDPREKQPRPKLAVQTTPSSLELTHEGFSTIEDLDKDRLATFLPQPKTRHRPQSPPSLGSSLPLSGQRLGSAPVDQNGLFPTNKKQKEKGGPPSVFVELVSSPEPAKSSCPRASKPEKALREVSGNRPPPDRSTIYELSTSCKLPPAQASSDKAGSRGKPPFPTFKPIVLPPRSFSIQVVLDNREVKNRTNRDYISKQLMHLGITPLVRSLPLGDIFWVAKVHDPTLLSSQGEEGDEIALDWIVERKRLDDLVGSITDGRFNEQKFRLRRSGLKNVVYLVEHYNLSKEDHDKFGEAIMSAIVNTQVVNGYFVKRTEYLDESIRYIAHLTSLLKSMYESIPLYIIPTTALSMDTYVPLLEHLRTDPNHNNKTYHITLSTFDSLASKSDSLTLRDVYLKMLMCTRGISGDKALAIQRAWPTPKAFTEAFEQCDDDKRRESMVESALGHLVGRGVVKGVLSAKIADIWARA